MKNKIIAAIIAALSIFVFLFAVSCGDNSSANNGGTDTENVTESADSAGGSEKESSGEESASAGETGSESDSEEESESEEDFGDLDMSIAGEYTVFMNTQTGIHNIPFTLTVTNKLKTEGTAFGNVSIKGYTGEAGYITIGEYHAYYDGGDVIVSTVNRNYSSFGATDTVYIAVRGNVSLTEYANFNEHKTKLTKWSYGGRETVTVFVYEDNVYVGVSFKTTPAVKSISGIWSVKENDSGFTYNYLVNSLSVIGADGKNIANFGTNGSDLKPIDDYYGVYEFDANGMLEANFGSLSISGTGKATLNDKEYSYTGISADNIRLDNGQIIILNRDTQTYKLPTDGNEGEYKNGDEIIYLDGYGKAELPDERIGEYNLSGKILKITVGAETLKFNVNGYTYTDYDASALPVFAGFTYQGKMIPYNYRYDDEDDEESYDQAESAKITFSSEEQTLSLLCTNYGGYYKYIDVQDVAYEFDEETNVVEFTYDGFTIRLQMSKNCSSLKGCDEDYARIKYGTNTDFCFYHVTGGKVIWYDFLKA